MTPRIETCNKNKLVGLRMSMSMADFKVGELWKRFGPVQKDIKNRKNTDVISLAVYPPEYFSNFKPDRAFEKWSAVEVSSFDEVPEGLEKFELPSGLYAVFDYRGSGTDQSVFQYILGEWLPASEYRLDDRPHFEVLGERYRNNDPESEEEIWIPIKEKP
jgi:AraC family transcriptional regulator